MGRIRTIKPEFPQSESVGRLSRDARLLFVQVWTICDDYGRCRAAIRLLAGQLYPYDDDAAAGLPAWLDELQRQGLVRLYSVDGSAYLECTGWSKHQRVDNAGKTSIPPPPAATDEACDGSRGESPRTTANLGDSRLDLGPRTKDLGPRSTRAASAAEPRPEPAAASQEPPDPKAKRVDRPDDVPEAVWRDWLAVRKGKRAAVTETAIANIRREAAAAGMTLADALAMSAAQGWQGFRADWAARTSGRGGGSSGPIVPKSLPVGSYLAPGEDPAQTW